MAQGSTPLNRCPLCGTRTRGYYCWAHDWAAGAEPPAKKLELVAGASTGSGRRLVRK